MSGAVCMPMALAPMPNAGALCVRPSGSVFVKLSGPSARVAAQRAAFRSFCASLVEAP